MPAKKNESVIAICIQEPWEEGSSMDLGLINGDSLRFVHQAFITDTIFSAWNVAQADVHVYYVNEDARKRLVKVVSDYVKKKLGDKKAKEFDKRFKLFEQPEDRWGVRTEAVLKYSFMAGYKNVLVVGSRTPTISYKNMEAALSMLKKSDAVFGPTPEGRYYCIGMTGAPHIDLSSFDWKSPSIYSEVTDAFAKEKLSWSELEIWYCVETTDEMEIMIRDVNQCRWEGDRDTAKETEILMERILSKMEP
jgi:glycosyltransferase A (GT-A) superfamily protein (DUF2064 family)